MAGEAQYRDLWICSAFQSGDRWGVRHHRVRKSGDFWCNERGHYVTCTDTGIGHADTREAAVRSYLAYLQKLCDESRRLLEQREKSYAEVEALLTALDPHA
jgi:hypothetical protein